MSAGTSAPDLDALIRKLEAERYAPTPRRSQPKVDEQAEQARRRAELAAAIAGFRCPAKPRRAKARSLQ